MQMGVKMTIHLLNEENMITNDHGITLITEKMNCFFIGHKAMNKSGYTWGIEKDNEGNI
jgi:uncharacterized protein involved in tellurium resistance